jgi:hypothetical protein
MEFVVGMLVTVNIINMIIEIILFIKYVSLYNQVNNMYDDTVDNIKDIGELERRLDSFENQPKDQGEHDVY